MSAVSIVSRAVICTTKVPKFSLRAALASSLLLMNSTRLIVGKASAAV